METRLTTPFGGGRFSARAALLQKSVAERQEQLKDGTGRNDDGRADKFALISALTEARFAYGLGDRALAVLEALLSFVPGRILDGSAPLVVFPSNRALSARARGMAPATLRRHLAQLGALGFLIRRDSPNGKRYQLRDERGLGAEAFGFDLAPLALRAAEIETAAETARAEHRRERALRTEITLEQRDIARIVATALEEGRAGDWEGFAARFASEGSRLRRRAALVELEARLTALARLRAEVENAYLSSLSSEEMSANDRQDERHSQNSNTESRSELNGREVLERARPEAAADADKIPVLERKALGVSLERILKACPAISDYGKDGMIRGAEEFLKIAGLVRSMLGVSPDAWKKAEEAMGRQTAAAVIAMVLERADEIRSPGGYLRNLTAKAEKGAFSIIPMLKALEARREAGE